MSTRRGVAATLVVALLAAGCAAVVRDRLPGTLGWSTCGAFQCARLAVPLNHADPAGEKIEISVLRRPAEDPEHRIGALVMNPGGPGGSGIELVRDSGAEFVDAQTRARFDLIGFDPRGVGQSAPVRCLPDEDLPFVRGAAAVDQVREVTARCVQRAGHVLPYLTTAATARDMDLLRAALGEEKLTYYGASYGTALGTVYADLFPGRVRALVLDGPLDPATWFGDRSRLDRLNATGFQQALEAFFAGCRRNPAACRFGAGDPAAALDRLLARIGARPLPVPGGAPVDRAEAVAAIGSALYDKAAWPSLAAALQRADAGDGTGLRPLSNQQSGRRPDGSRDNSTDARLAIRCGDGGRVADPVALAAELKRLSPVFGDDSGVDACRFWPGPAERYDPGAVLAKGAPPILVVATTGDPATPLPGGRALATELESGVLMMLEGNRHVAYGRDRSPCVESAVARYLIDLMPPADGTQCPREAVHP